MALPFDPIAILGYGHFGRALSALASDAGLKVRVYDPHVAVPAAQRAPTLQACLSGAPCALLAVPMEAFRDVLGGIRPLLSRESVVIDVTSVKRPAVQACRDLLGDVIPWVATHPLFGPASLARGEPLRVVVCPDTPHHSARAQVEALYHRLGCRIILQDSDGHDQLMAETHALAFFIAKGMLSIGAGQGQQGVPPSFGAMASTIETVRSDAGHLFFSIQHANPHAAAARKRLLDALGRIHDELAAVKQSPTSAAERLAIPTAPPPELADTREAIDVIDASIVQLLAQRAQLARRAARVKAEGGRAVHDPAREHRLLEARREAATGADLDPDATADVFEAILRLSRTEQHRWLDAHTRTSQKPPVRP